MEGRDRPRPDVKSRAVAMIAGTAVTGLGDLEILSTAPAANSSFARPMDRLLGLTTETGAPPIVDAP